MDLVSYIWGGGGQTHLVDITVAGTASSVYQSGAAKDALYATRAREQEKHF